MRCRHCSFREDGCFICDPPKPVERESARHCPHCNTQLTGMVAHATVVTCDATMADLAAARAEVERLRWIATAAVRYLQADVDENDPSPRVTTEMRRALQHARIAARRRLDDLLTEDDEARAARTADGGTGT